MSETENINEDLLGLIEELAGEIGIGVDQAITNIERQYGLDLASIEDDDAEEFVAAFEAEDASKIEDVLIEQGVPDDQAKEFREMVEAQKEAGTAGGESRGNGDTPPETASGGGGGVSEERVRSIVRDETGSAVREALQSAQAQSQQAQGGGGNPQQQEMIMRLAAQFLDDGGGGEAAALGQEVQNAAMQSFLKELRKPSLGDILEMKAWKKIADDPEMEKEIERLYGGGEDEDENSVMGMFPMDDTDDSDSEDD